MGYNKFTVAKILVQSDSVAEQNFELVSEAIEVGNIAIIGKHPDIDKFEVSCVDRASKDEIAIIPVIHIGGAAKDQKGSTSKVDELHVRSSRAGESGSVYDETIIRGQLGGYGSTNIPKTTAESKLRTTILTPSPYYNNEAYDFINENKFINALDTPLSTFSIDVDAASYSNMRRFINKGSFPPKNAVRIEEFINYFTYDYPQPDGKHPFSITTEISECPWDNTHRLAHIGLQGKDVSMNELPSSNLVFLIDVSGSMKRPEKLPLLKSAFKLLVNKLDEGDRVAIVTYAGNAGLQLPSTPGCQKDAILAAIDRLGAGGSTAGAAGIKLAYQIAKDNFMKSGNNRVILATDGDFNVGISSDEGLVKLIEEKRDQGIFLTVLGFGAGNYKGSKMEKLADKGNGNYSYIDNIIEAKKVLVNEMKGTLFTIAKDVKIQIEFNPAKVQAYRLIGYENRILNKEDFADDAKDAGELGSGHTATALYEIIPANPEDFEAQTGELRYQVMRLRGDAFESPELLTVKFRYKKPDGNKSRLIEHHVIDTDIALKRTSDNFRFSAAAAEFGMLLRDSQFKGNASYEQVLELARDSKGADSNGYRREFIELADVCKSLANSYSDR
ncbi:MAG: VWA domain-containing protein [candidate division Zixibacteria bacterium]|nr:VWA domain-containing protein [candidate division Zixibacteria bacterium]